MFTSATKNPFVWLFVLLLSCGLQSCTYDQLDGSIPKTAAASAQIKLIINTTTPSSISYEAEIRELRLLLFERGSGVCVVNQKLSIDGKEDLSDLRNQSSLRFDPIQVSTGLYDLVLLANENSEMTDLSAYRAALAQIKHKIDLYQPALRQIPYAIGPDHSYKAPQGPLLMSSYRDKLRIDKGTEDKPMLIESSLVTALSVVDVVFKNSEKDKQGAVIPTNKRIYEIGLENIMRHFSNPAIYESDPQRASLTSLVQPVDISESAYQQEEIASFRFFVPEIIRHEKGSGPEPKSALKLAGVGFDTQSFAFRHAKEELSEDLDQFKRLFESYSPAPELENEVTNSIVRHVFNRITVSLGTAGSIIQAKFEILPWQEVESDRDYKAAEYDFEPQQDLADREQHLFTTHQQEPVSFEIRLKSPVGAPWRISLTNALDFALVAQPGTAQDGVLGAFRGVVKEDTSYRFSIEPRRPFTGTPRYTELFLVVDGKEEQLIPQLKEQNTPSGPNYRYKIKQIE